MQLGDLLNKLAVQGGIPATDKELIALLSNAAISTATINDEFANKLQSGLLTIEAAKNDPTLKSYFTALALNALDSELEGLMNEFEIPDEIKTELKTEKSSYKRAAALTKKVKELESKKATASGEDKSKLAKQIDDLNRELSTVKQNFDKEKSEMIESHKADRINWELNNYFNGYSYVTPISKEANIKVAQGLINEELIKLGLKIENTDNNLKLLTSAGTDFYQNNQKVNVKDFIDKTLSTHKVIAIEDKNKQQQQQQQSNFNQFNQNQNQNQIKKSRAAIEVDKMLATDLANAATT